MVRLSFPKVFFFFTGRFLKIYLANYFGHMLNNLSILYTTLLPIHSNKKKMESFHPVSFLSFKTPHFNKRGTSCHMILTVSHKGVIYNWFDLNSLRLFSQQVWRPVSLHVWCVRPQIAAAGLWCCFRPGLQWLRAGGSLLRSGRSNLWNHSRVSYAPQAWSRCCWWGASFLHTLALKYFQC